MKKELLKTTLGFVGLFVGLSVVFAVSVQAAKSGCGSTRRLMRVLPYGMEGW